MTYTIVDPDGTVIDTAKVGAIALQKKETIEQAFPENGPYAIKVK